MTTPPPTRYLPVNINNDAHIPPLQAPARRRRRPLRLRDHLLRLDQALPLRAPVPVRGSNLPLSLLQQIQPRLQPDNARPLRAQAAALQAAARARRRRAEGRDEAR